jgi:hypothetical protein
MITSSSGDHLIPFRNTRGRHDERDAAKIIWRGRAAPHDQQSTCRQVGDSRPDLWRYDRYHGT